VPARHPSHRLQTALVLTAFAIGTTAIALVHRPADTHSAADADPELPPGAEVCAERQGYATTAVVWATRTRANTDFHFAVFGPDGRPRIGPTTIAHGGQVDPSCGLASREGRYAVVWPFYDGVYEHEGSLQLAFLDPETGRPGAPRVLDETKGGDEHTVESFTATPRGFTLRFSTALDPSVRRLDLDVDGRIRSMLAALVRSDTTAGE
jgi:hypothetical protein